jgi:hypothetical protein
MKCVACGCELGSASINNMCMVCYNKSQMFHPVPQLCPVCRGNGLVSAGFYEQTSGIWTGTGFEKCRSCDGKGYVVV